MHRLYILCWIRFVQYFSLLIMAVGSIALLIDALIQLWSRRLLSILTLTTHTLSRTHLSTTTNTMTVADNESRQSYVRRTSENRLDKLYRCST